MNLGSWPLASGVWQKTFEPGVCISRDHELEVKIEKFV